MLDSLAVSESPRVQTNDSRGIVERSKPLVIEKQGGNGRSGVHTAKEIGDQKRQAIVLALSAGKSKRAIMRELHTSIHVVNIVLAEEWEQVTTRKGILAAQAEANALAAGEQIAKHLATGKIPIQSLVPVYGVSLDKVALLRNDPQQIQVTHSIDLGPNLYEKIAQLQHKIERPIQATVIEDVACPQS